MKHMMSMAESASLHILARQADVCAVLQQWTKRQSLSDRPVSLALGSHLTPLLQDSFYTYNISINLIIIIIIIKGIYTVQVRKGHKCAKPSALQTM